MFISYIFKINTFNQNVFSLLVGTEKYHIQVSHHLRVGKNALNEYDQKALRKVYPESTSLLCQFHALCTAWRWLWNSNNGVQPSYRGYLYNLIKQAVFAVQLMSWLMPWLYCTMTNLLSAVTSSSSIVTSYYRRVRCGQAATDRMSHWGVTIPTIEWKVRSELSKTEYSPDWRHSTWYSSSTSLSHNWSRTMREDWRGLLEYSSYKW